MKIQCNACEAAQANVLCCADEAALCWACDKEIHAANKLASKHQRVSLSNSSSPMPKCDICQETTGHFFCLEDRALLCRKCDVAIHTANSYVSAHQRFLLTGVKVGLEPTGPVVSSSKLTSGEKILGKPSTSSSKKGISLTFSGASNKTLSGEAGVDEVFPKKVSFSANTTPSVIPDLPLEEFLGSTDFNQNYGFIDQGFSKGDNSKLGESDWSPIYRAAAASDDVDIDECLGQVPEITWTVPEVPSAPTASGLDWPRNFCSDFLENSIYVPDICSLQIPQRYQQDSVNSKGRR